MKARIVRLGGKGPAAAKAYLRYLERDGTPRDGGPGNFNTGQSRELRRIAAQLSKEFGLSFADAEPGTMSEGKVTRSVQLGNKTFALVPRRPVLGQSASRFRESCARTGST